MEEGLTKKETTSRLKGKVKRNRMPVLIAKSQKKMNTSGK
jgi:hypothetical protein